MGYLTSAGSLARMIGPPFATTIFSYSGFRTIALFGCVIGTMIVALLITFKWWSSLDDPSREPENLQERQSKEKQIKMVDPKGAYPRETESAALLREEMSAEGFDEEPDRQESERGIKPAHSSLQICSSEQVGDCSMSKQRSGAGLDEESDGQQSQNGMNLAHSSLQTRS